MRHKALSFGDRARAAVISGGIGLLLATASLAAPALAADQPTASTAQTTPDAIGHQTHQLHGVVKGAPGASSFLVSTERYGDITVKFDGVTPRGRGHAHGRARSFEVAKASDLKDKDRVVVQGRASSTEAKTFIARRVHVLPAPGASAHAQHLVGTISTVSTANGTTTLTIQLADGSTQTVTVSSATKIRPEGKTVADLTSGKKVTVVSKNGAATGVVVMPA